MDLKCFKKSKENEVCFYLSLAEEGQIKITEDQKAV